MGYYRDDWPKMQDSSDFDGRQTLTLARSGRSPFRKEWDVMLLVREIEENLHSQVVEIPFVYHGSNNYGFHIQLSNRPDVIARLARGDVNMPGFSGLSIDAQIPEVKFEAATYELFHSEPGILASRLLYHRIPRQHDGPRLQHPQDITGRRLLVFEKAEGESEVWHDLDQAQRVASLLAQSARIRAALFNYQLPLEFAAAWLRERLFEHKPKSLPLPVAPTREFWVALFTAKINATIRNIGDMIGWESDNETVGPIAAAAKQSLLRLIPLMMPMDNDQTDLYRLVLEHGDFGIHNMSITMDASNEPLVTSVFDWETGCIVPAILSDPLMAVTVDLVADEDAAPSTTLVNSDATPSNREEYMTWARQYIEPLFHHAPEYERAIKAGKDARHLWFALRDWRGEDPEGYFGDLGTWAERRIKELAASNWPLRSTEVKWRLNHQNSEAEGTLRGL
ncbi:hypothetical protein TOPH_06185, partial [Tolypocladium ophioglossoides CBS 100239]